MLIAHGPAGYLIGTMADRARQRFDLVMAGLAGGLFPDLDAVGFHVGIVQGFTAQRRFIGRVFGSLSR